MEITDEEFKYFFLQQLKVRKIQELSEQIDVKPNEYLFRELVNKINFDEEEFEELINFIITKYNVHRELNQILGQLEDNKVLKANNLVYQDEIIDCDGGQDEITIQYKKRISESVW